MAEGNAAIILQDYLDNVSAALMTEDWSAYRDAVILPLHLISNDETRIVATDDALRVGFDQFCATLKIQHITDYIRLVESAGFVDDDMISGSYITHLLVRSHRILNPFRSQMTLKLQVDRWRVASVTTGLDDSRWPLIRSETSPDTDTNSDKGPLQ